MNKHGGNRPGSGRKRSESKKIRVSYSLAPDVVDFLRSNETPASQLIENAVRNYYNLTENLRNEQDIPA